MRLSRLTVATLLMAASTMLSAAELRVRAVDGGEGLRSTLAAAHDGDVVRISAGHYRGRFTVDRSIHLIGEGWPVLDGGDSGTVLTIRGAGASLCGLVIRGSGDSLDEENSGVSIGAPEVRVTNNRLEDVLFGIYARKSANAVIQDNVIRTKPLDLPRRGDAIRIWYSDGVTVSGNRVLDSRDVVLWYSADLDVYGNVVRGGRYGLHFMYCDDARIEHNLLLDNSVGAFLMYSRRLHLVGNTIVGNHGPSGYGVGLKDMDDARIEGNLFAGNRAGAYLDNSPRDSRSRASILRNRFVGNDNGVELMPNVERAEFAGNGFEENEEQIAWAGRGGDSGANSWRGNYWSDYRGFDADGDGVGDVPYRSERLFESLSDRSPALRLFRYSPVSEAVDLAARILPVVKPVPKLEDAAPSMAPPRLDGLPPIPRSPKGPLVPVAAGMLAGAGLLWARPRWGRGGARTRSREASMTAEQIREVPPVRTDSLRKTFGERVALEDVSFEVETGESVALWGANGAGKTTLLRTLLGVLPCEGAVQVMGLDPRSAGKAVRRFIGFVPQEIAFEGEMRVGQTMEFFARLRGAGSERGRDLMKRLELGEHEGKRVRELSGGLKQRLALAVALLSDPPLLLLDEPTANLDARARREFIRLLETLRLEKTLIFTSHRVEEVLTLADRVLWLEEGRLVRDTPAAGLLHHDEGDVSVHILVPERKRDEAARILDEVATRVGRLGPYLTIRVPQSKKVECLERLLRADIPVDDFGVDVNGRGLEAHDAPR